MSETEARNCARQRIAEQMKDAVWHNTGFTTAPVTAPTSLTFDAFVAAWDKIAQLSPAPVPPVDLPDFLKLRLFYRVSEFIEKVDGDGQPVFYKIKAGMMWGCDHETFVMHPDNRDDFLKAAAAAGAVAVDLAALQRGEIDDYSRPISAPEGAS